MVKLVTKCSLPCIHISMTSLALSIKKWGLSPPLNLECPYDLFGQWDNSTMRLGKYLPIGTCSLGIPSTNILTVLVYGS